MHPNRRRTRVTAAAAASLAALLAVAAPAPAGNITQQVTVDDPPGAPAFAFTPDRVNTDLVDSRVHWTRGEQGDAEHGVRQEASLFRLPPTSGEIDFTRDFSAGTFPYYCPVHGSPGRGMDGIIRVVPNFDSDPQGVPAFTVRWGKEESTDTGGRFDVRYRRQGASGWTLWKNDTRLHLAEFGVDDEPIRVAEGRSYEFQARSEKANDPDKRSGWSPVLVAAP